MALEAVMNLSGVCHVFLAFDIGYSVDLNEGERRVATGRRRSLAHRRKRQQWLEYEPRPLQVTRQDAALAVGRWRTAETVDATVFDFGALSIHYRVPFSGADFPALVELSGALYEHVGIREDGWRRAEQLLANLGPAVRKPRLSEASEDYVVFAVEAWGGEPVAALLAAHQQAIAQVLQAEPGRLSPQQVEESLRSRLSFTPDDLAIFDWNAGLLLDAEPSDVLMVLEHVNLELLELRQLDQRLDEALEQAWEERRARAWLWPAESRELRRLAELQIEYSLAFEGIDNAVKLVGDQFLARVYRLAAERFHLSAWRAAVSHKLQGIDAVWQKRSGFLATRRMEAMEIVIILLIAFSIVLPFLGAAAK